MELIMLNTEFLSIIINGIVFFSFIFLIIYYFVLEEKLKTIIPITLILISFIIWTFVKKQRINTRRENNWNK